METAFKKLRKKQGLTQDQLAAIANVPRICISRYESGKYYPSIANAMKLAKALGVTVDELIGQKAG